MSEKFWKSKCDSNRETCDELKQLEIQLRNAYTMKALEAQIAEKEANRVGELAREKLSVKLMKLKDEKIIDDEIKKNKEIMKKRDEYRNVLEEQIEAKYLEKLVHDETDRREREVLIEVDRIIDEEYEIMRKNKRDTLRETLRRERLIFLEMRDIKHAMEIEMEEIASIKVSEYQDEIMKRSMEMRKLLEEQRKKRQIVIDSVAKLFVDKESAKIERESLINDLIAEEIRQQLLIEEHETEFKIKQKKLELAHNLKEQMMFSVESEERYRQFDRIFADNVMARIMEDERLAILTAEARKRKQIDYRRDLSKLIEERERIRENTVAALKDEWREAKIEEQIRRQKIKEERQRLIQKHAKNVGGYLKKGLLTKEEEDKFLPKKSLF